MKKKNSNDTLVEHIASIKRVSKTTTGGRKFSVSAYMIVGDKSGRVGYGKGKAKEVNEAKTKASAKARKSIIRVPLDRGRTIHHDVIGRSGAATVILKRAKSGKGIIAGGPLRGVFECLGIHDIVAKSLGSRNSYAMVEAVFDALSQLSSRRAVANKRGKKVGEIMTLNSARLAREKEK
ncbi:30S ribosomal protein S5 [Rickettsiales endosymbiont of Paramecium tredecaurelia]|uniref:30S ribosomal protein S5 n=1 Tax=Candidatus Sarmatiella mevalonica TaxID=2770581 RepID=UPI001920AC09|nr:30S ribosomal protein S5 [Candidatus Sarmatiella mevalonica]MBL3284435.1 30S ribosomal protein S5 [Candidatus Sarmatiella mevalonica]